MPREPPSAKERAASLQSEEHARVEESRVSAPLPMGFGEALPICLRIASFGGGYYLETWLWE